MKYMRIVGLGGNVIHVQESNRKNAGFKQRVISHDDFVELMKSDFPAYFEEFLNSPNANEPEFFGHDCCSFFYHYGETRDMIRSGEAYIFEGGC